MSKQDDSSEIFVVDSLSKYVLAIETLTNHCGYVNENNFRGVKNKEYDLIPKLYRKFKDDGDNYIYNFFKGNEIIEQFKKYSYPLISNKPSDKDFLQWLVLAQHYNVPTRLLDFTINPLVALYFAVEDLRYVNDGAVWLLNKNLFDIFFERNNIVPHITQLSEGNQIDNKENMLPEIIIPYYYDNRMENQSSRFLLFNLNITPLNKYENVNVFTLKNHHVEEYQKEKSKRYFDAGENNFLAKIVVKGISKGELLDELNLFGINEMYIYRSLDNVGKFIDERLTLNKHSVGGKEYTEFIMSLEPSQE